MESQSRNNILLLGILAIVLSAVITGGIVYVVQNKQNTDTKNELQAQITSLKSQISALHTATPSASVTPAATATPSATATPTPSLTDTQLLNFTYLNASQKPITLVNGDGEFTIAGSKGTLSLQKEFTSSGDLNGDGVEDKVVVLSEYDGGTGSSLMMAVVLNKDGKPVLSDQHGIFGDRDTLDSISINKGMVTIKGKVHGPSQALADLANQPKTEVYKMLNNKLVAQ